MKITEKMSIQWVIVWFAVLTGITWLGMYVWKWEHLPRVLSVHILNVSKGSALFIRTPHGRRILVGGGGGSDVIRKVSKLTPFYDRTIDELFVLPDEGNANGVLDVLGRFSPRQIYMPEIPELKASTTDPFETIRTEAEKNGTKIIESMKKEYVLDEYEGKVVKVDVLQYGILRLSYGTRAFLFADVISRKDQQSMEVSLDESLRGDVLVMRSGAPTRVSTHFFEKVHPEYVVLSKMPARPKKEILIKATSTKSGSIKKSADPPFNMYEQKGVQVYGLDRGGEVEFVSDGRLLHVRQEM